MANMKAWQFSAPGPLDASFRLVDNAPKPEAQQLRDAQVLVKVSASGLNPADYKVPELGVVARAIVSFPKIAAMDLSGVVVAVGSGVTDLQAGAHVIGRVNPMGKTGSLCEFVVLERDEVVTFTPSGSFDSDHAAGMPTAALTAYQTIAPYVEEGRGDRVFINGGSGGVGTLCVQVAKLLGCHVTTSCSTAKTGLCQDLGADEIIDYKTTNITDKLKGSGRKFRVIVDNVGNSPADLFSSSNAYLEPGCPYVFVGGKMSFTSVKNLAMARLLPAFLGGATGTFVTFITKTARHDLEVLSKWAADGKLRIVVDKVFDFDQANTAMQYVKEGSSNGKTVVRVQSA